MLYLHFDESGRFVGKTSEPNDGHYSFKVAKGKELGERFSVVNGKLVDNYPGKSDEEVLAILAEEASKAAEPTAQPIKPAPRPITKLAFMNRFTMEELAAIYTAAKTEVMVEVFLDKLKIAEEVNLADAQTIGGLQALAASGLLTEARVQEVLQ